VRVANPYSIHRALSQVAEKTGQEGLKEFGQALPPARCRLNRQYFIASRLLFRQARLLKNEEVVSAEKPPVRSGPLFQPIVLSSDAAGISIFDRRCRVAVLTAPTISHATVSSPRCELTIMS
jgi:hypothetical protein